MIFVLPELSRQRLTRLGIFVQAGLFVCLNFLQCRLVSTIKSAVNKSVSQARYVGNNVARLPIMRLLHFATNHYWKTINPFIFIIVFLLVSVGADAVTLPGTVISNTATASFNYQANSIVATSNAVNVVTTIIRTPSSINLYQLDLKASTITLPVPTKYASSGQVNARFIISPSPHVSLLGSGVKVLDPNTPLSLSLANGYTTGEPIFIEVKDLDQNLNPTIKETVNVIVISSVGDKERLKLTETGVNTGIFIAYIQSTSAAVVQYNGLLTLGEGTNLTVQYIDQYDPSDISIDKSLVDPFGRVFSSYDGKLQNGAVVTLLGANGLPATVYGDDGVSLFSNPVVTGSTVTDSGGTIYKFPAGEYRFPRMAPGNYKLVVTPAPGFVAPSQSSTAALQKLPKAPFVLKTNASFAQIFNLLAGSPLHVDIPVDPLPSALVITKSASKDYVAIGDFVQYTLKVENVDRAAVSNQITITDTLPAGLRYQAGSVRYDDVPGKAPVISADGRTLKFSIAHLLAGASVQVKYVTEITAATKLGRVVNRAAAEDNMQVRSNIALAAITVTEDLFTRHSFIAGRVIVGSCGKNSAFTDPGLASVRLFMEDGTYATTDENGNYHFEGITPGTHVVQLDKASIPDNYEVIDCVKNTRFAGTDFSQFVDIQGGSLWRTNFYVRKKPPLTGTTSLYVQSKLNDKSIKYSINMQNGNIPVKNYRLIVKLPQGIKYTAGSSVLNGTAINEPSVNDNIIVYRFGDLGSNWKRRLEFRAHLKGQANGSLVTTALVLLDTDLKKNIRSVPVKNKLEIRHAHVENKSMIYRAYFGPMGAQLSSSSKKKLQRAIKALGDVDILKNKITGYTDGVPINRRSWWLYKNNTALSMARAKVVGDYLINKLKLDKKTIELKAEGDKDPAAKNNTIHGRSLNRRAELVVSTRKIIDPGKVKLVIAKSKVRKIILKGQPKRKIEKLIEAPVVPEQRDISVFDEFWIKNKKPGYKWLMPDKNFSPAQPSVNIAIKHKPSDNFEMRLNGKPLDALFYFGSIKNKQGTVARSYWQGVHLSNGNNKFEFIVKNKTGKVIERMQRDIVFSGIPVRAELVKKYSRLVADGRHRPVIALKVFDKAGFPARPGSRGKFTVAPPFLPYKTVKAYQTNRLSGLNNQQPEYTVGANGMAYIALEPTTTTGKVEVSLPFRGRKTTHLETWLQPEVRDWIMVGLAEGTMGYNSVSANQQPLNAAGVNDKYYRNGKISFYAKGKIKGKWLLTMAYDTAKKAVTGNSRVNQFINPNKYYTVYGDNSRQRYDASSADKLYIKIERDQFYALYGDMNTGLTVTDLAKFSRRMTGFKSAGDVKSLSYTAFAAENKNNFIKDEIQGEGISGLYHLTGKNIVINSDEIVLETRDRFRSENILSKKILRRYLDYDIDYQDGTILFRRPIQARDKNFNPVFIVANYEVETPVTGAITAGGRISKKLDKGKVIVGGTIIHDGSYLAKGNLYGADARIELNRQTEVKLEVATTDVKNKTKKLRGDAYSAEITHGGDTFKVRAYAKQQDAKFGLGQQSISQSGTRKLGAEGSYRLNNNSSVDATVYHEENLSSGAKRNAAETNVRYGNNNYALNAGARIARDKDGIGNINASNLLILGGSRNLFDNRMKIHGAAEISLGSNNANSDYPSRYTLGSDYFLTPKVNLFAENEWTSGRNQSTQMSRAGIRSTPWAGAQVNTAINQASNENGLRSFATMGLTQAFPITKRWSGSVTFDQAKTLRHPGAKPFYANVPIAQGTNNDYVAISMGTTYAAETYTINNRVEIRNADTENKVGILANWERNLIHGIGYSTSLRLFDTNRRDGSKNLDGRLRYSLAFRPLESHWIIFNRLDFKLDSNTDFAGIKTRQRKLIDNLAINYLIDSRNQMAFNFGTKYVVDSFDTAEYRSFTYLIGSEYRHDLNNKFDIGVHTKALYSANSAILQYSNGLSVGWNMTHNVWLSMGYNFSGFDDADFAAAGYAMRGPYIRFRMKFDQDTAAAIQKWLN